MTHPIVIEALEALLGAVRAIGRQVEELPNCGGRSPAVRVALDGAAATVRALVVAEADSARDLGVPLPHPGESVSFVSIYLNRDELQLLRDGIAALHRADNSKPRADWSTPGDAARNTLNSKPRADWSTPGDAARNTLDVKLVLAMECLP